VFLWQKEHAPGRTLMLKYLVACTNQSLETRLSNERVNSRPISRGPYHTIYQSSGTAKSCDVSIFEGGRQCP